MRQLFAPTEDFIKTQRSALGADAAAGSSVTLTLENNEGFSDTDFLVVGYEGNELAELVQINQAVTPGTNVRVATLKFNHLAGEPVILYRFNKRKFYGATSAAGAYTELTADGSPKDISPDNPAGTLLEYTDSAYTYFKATYYNSATTDETDIGDATATNGDESTRYASIYGIRKMAGLLGNPRYSDARVEIKRTQAEGEIKSSIASRYVLPLAEIPPILQYVCELLAGGYIDFEEFGDEGEGVKYLGEARGILKAIQEGRQILLGADDVELTRITTTDGLSSYPDGTDDADVKKFGMNQRF